MMFSFSKSRNNRGVFHVSIWPDVQTIKHILIVVSDQQAKSTEKLEGEKGTNKDEMQMKIQSNLFSWFLLKSNPHKYRVPVMNSYGGSDEEFYSAGCGRAKDYIITNAGPIATFRSDNMVWDFSEREGDPTTSLSKVKTTKTKILKTMIERWTHDSPYTDKVDMEISFPDNLFAKGEQFHVCIDKVTAPNEDNINVRCYELTNTGIECRSKRIVTESI